MIANSSRLVERRPRTSLVTDRAVARRLRVSMRIVRLWIATGAWPLPRGARGTSFLFESSDVERWLQTGIWPTGARFRSHGRSRIRAGLRMLRV